MNLLAGVLRVVAVALFVLVIVAGVLVAYIAKNGSFGPGVHTALERDIVAARMEVSAAEKTVAADKANTKAATNLLDARASLVLARAAAGEDVSREADVLVAEQPKNPLLLFAAAKAYEASPDRAVEASSFLQRAAKEVTPQAGELARIIYSEHSAVLEKRKEYSEALDFARKATQVTPVSIDSLNRLARLAETQKNYYDLASAYWRISTISPSDTQSLSRLAELEKTQPGVVARAKADFPQMELGR